MARVVVLARGGLDGERAALAVRLALALTLADHEVSLYLAGPAAALAPVPPVDLHAWTGPVAAELAACIDEAEVAVFVEAESLARLGLDQAPLRPGIATVGRVALLAAGAAAERWLVV